MSAVSALARTLDALRVRLQAQAQAPIAMPAVAPAQALATVLAAAAGAACAAVFWAAAAPIGPFGRIEAKPPQTQEEAGQALAVLSRFDPFFRSAPAQSGADASRLGLSLHSVRQDVRGGRGTAIIGRNGAQQQSFAVGDAVAPGVRLAAVGPDHVLLEQAGARLKLHFPGAPGGASVVEQAGAASAEEAAASAPPASGFVEGAPTAIDPLALLKQAQFQPRLVNGKITGFQVVSGSGPMFEKSGLRAGDVVVRLANTPIDRFELLEDLKIDLGQRSQTPVTIERGGSIITLLWTQAGSL